MEKWQCQVEIWTTKYKIKSKGFVTVIEELKQHISAKTLKFKRCKSRVKHNRQNRTFKNKSYMKSKMEKWGKNSWCLMQKNRLNSGVNCRTTQLTMTEMLSEWQDRKSWNVLHNKAMMMFPYKEDVFIRIRRMSNWKAPGSDRLHGFWQKKITFLHQVMVKHLDDCIQTGKLLIGW